MFHRTAAGDAAYNDRSSSLSVTHRRMLALLDGKRTVDAIARGFRAGEPLPVLRDLQSMGLVQSTSNVPAPLSHDAQTRPALTSQQFVAARTAAASAASELLGSTARSLVRDLEQCRDPRTLRQTIDIVNERLERVLGADAVAIFVDAVRRAAVKA
ncbi:MAG: hypothetical protein ACRDAM_22240 [Casimicrobium sp.]